MRLLLGLINYWGLGTHWDWAGLLGIEVHYWGLGGSLGLGRTAGYYGLITGNWGDHWD